MVPLSQCRVPLPMGAHRGEREKCSGGYSGGKGSVLRGGWHHLVCAHGRVVCTPYAHRDAHDQRRCTTCCGDVHYAGYAYPISCLGLQNHHYSGVIECAIYAPRVRGREGRCAPILLVIRVRGRRHPQALSPPCKPTTSPGRKEGGTLEECPPKAPPVALWQSLMPGRLPSCAGVLHDPTHRCRR